MISLEFVFFHLCMTVSENLLSVFPRESKSVRVQCLDPDLFPLQVSCSRNNGSLRSFGHGRRRLTNRQAFSLGVIDMFSVCVVKHLLERGVIVIHILEGLLLRELWLGQGLDISLHEVVGLGLITCAEVGIVRRHHLLVGGVRSVITNLMKAEGQQELREIEGE